MKLEDGIYNAKPFGPAKLGVSAVKETPQVVVTLELETGHKLSWFGYFTEAAAERTVEALKILGFKGKSLSDLDGAILKGDVSVTVETEEYEGRQRARIAWINSIGFVPHPMNDEGKKKIGEYFDKFLK